MHQDEFRQAGKEIEENINKLATDVRKEIADTSTELKGEIATTSSEIREELTNTTAELNETIEALDEELSNEIMEHTSNEDIHFTVDEREAVAKIGSLEQAIENINTILGGTTRQHIVSSLEEMYNLEDVLHADICHVLEEKETYLYDKNDLVGDGDT